MTSVQRWLLACLLGAGALLTVGIDTQRSMPLRAPLASVLPAELAAVAGRDVTLSPEERRVAGVTEYVLRDYLTVSAARVGVPSGVSVYIGYYDRQTQGKTIHSPKNCLPGGGWEPLTSTRETITTASGPITVNRYLLHNGTQQALVLYWYQGRGHIEANEYVVKWNLLRDAALRGRTEEALVRVLVPVTDTEARAFELAAQAARAVIPGLQTVLPS